ncbi:MAG TPA: acyl carrier protein [Patescibacteria group bacterium]|nr:acyl carrier protein [Patescibacteria group bacterium]
MESEFANTKQKIKRELADYLGVDMEDIDDETEFTTDLHMDAVMLTDFMEILTKAGFDVTQLDFNEIETFLDLVEALTAHE